MSLGVVGQRCISEREPELGLGVVASVDRARIGVQFPAVGEQRLYALDTPVLKRVQFRPGETVAAKNGDSFVIESVAEEAGLLVYLGAGGRRVREDAISDVASLGLPQQRLMAAQTDPSEVFDLRVQALQAQWRFRQSEVRGFLGGRVDLIPHQIYILHEAASRQIPRVLLADEVGLGKTIEACLIVQRLLAIGRASRVLVLVPESLVHQWFVELLRRFNLWFSIYDEERCIAAERSDPGGNPFLDAQLALTSVGFLAGNELRGAQAIEAGWDIVVIDEAHHLKWAPEHPSPEYTLAEKLAQRAPGLLLLTATPTQLGLESHFARLRLLDPDRYRDLDAFRREAEDYIAVAEVAEKLLESKPLAGRDRATLQRIFARDADGLSRRLAALDAGAADARDELIRALLDQHGTGRVMFRNTRASMSGFPKRKFCPAPVDAPAPALLARIRRELEAEETGNESAVRYSFKDDPRIDWLAAFLKKHRTAKALLICRSQRKVAAIEAALQEKIKVKSALFHEGLPLVQRDRNAAWFAEPDGAQLLLCSEIGSEGRNFQFAHHLVLFDLPLNPGLVEQRIGRLDRIGQTETIRIHIPCVRGSSEEAVLEWYHRGLDALETPLHGGNEYHDRFRERLLILALRWGDEKRDPAAEAQFAELIEETFQFRRELGRKLKRVRDRLLELNSFDRSLAGRVIERIRETESDTFPRRFLLELLDHFGVRVAEHEGGEVFLDPSHAFVESFPSIPAEGMLATFDRARAIAREDIRFISPDHPLMRDALDLLINSAAGTTAFAVSEADEPNLLLEAIFVCETVADARWHVEQFFAPTPVRVVVDVRGRDLTAGRESAAWARDLEDGDIHRFLEQPGFNREALDAMIASATERAQASAEELKRAADAKAGATLRVELQRLIDLRKINDHVRPEEIELARERLERTREAIAQARLRLDALRLVVEGEIDALRKS